MFYLTFQKCDALRDELSWTHYSLLLKVEIDVVDHIIATKTEYFSFKDRKLLQCC